MRRRRLDVDDDLARVGEFHRVAQQVNDDLPHARFIAGHGVTDFGRDFEGEFQTLLRRLGREHVNGSFHAGREREGALLHFHLAGLDFGNVQDVVDDREQRLAAGPDGLDVVPLLRRQTGAQEQAGHGDDAVHGRANLVAHVGDELGLALRRAFRRRAGEAEFPRAFREQIMRALLPRRREDARFQFGKNEGLGDEVVRAELEGLDFLLNCPVRGEHDHGDVRDLDGRLERAQHGQTVHAGQAQVEQHHIEDAVMNFFQRLEAVPHDGNVVTGQAAANGGGDLRLILHEQHGGRGRMAEQFFWTEPERHRGGSPADGFEFCEFCDSHAESLGRTGTVIKSGVKIVGPCQ